MAKGYWIVRVDIADPEQYKKYIAANAAPLRKHGARFLVRAGTYEAVVYYTCPAADVGSNVELRFQESRLEGKVSEANDPPLMGKEHDRVPREGESYVKDFKPLTLGEIELKAGRGELKLHALKMPGKQVMDVRMVTLRLKAHDAR